MSGIVFDTSIYITAFRKGDLSILESRRASHIIGGESHPLWLSAVVLSELLIGAANKTSRKKLLDVEKEFININRLLVPSGRDWRLVGEVLAQVGERYGYEHVGRVRMTNDALIAMSAARNGFTVLTKNAADFQKIAEICPFLWEET